MKSWQVQFKLIKHTVKKGKSRANTNYTLYYSHTMYVYTMKITFIFSIPFCKFEFIDLFHRTVVVPIMISLSLPHSI